MNNFPGDRMNCSFTTPEAPSASFNFSLSLLEEDLSEEVEWAHVAQLLFYVTVMVLSLLGNLLVVIAVLTQRSMRTTVNYYLLNMAVADVLIVIFCMWVHFMKTYIFTSSYKLGPFMCRIESFAKMTCLTACVLTLTAISCDRFIAILFPLHAAARITKRRTSCIILFIWIVSTVVAIPLIVYSKLYNVQFAGQEEMSFCGSSWPSVSLWSAEKSECVLVSIMQKLYYVTATVLLFFLPIAVMLTAYSFIIWKLWINRVPEELSNTNNNSLHNRSKKKVVQMVCYVLVAFIVCWMPLQVTVLYSQFRGDSNKQMPAWFTTLSSFATNLAFSNSLVNPVIYGGFNRQFRQAILQLLKCKATRVQEARMRWSTRDGTLAVRRPTKRVRDPLTAFDNCQDSVMTISNMVA